MMTLSATSAQPQSSAPSTDGEPITGTAPYRYSFETDEQYRARLEEIEKTGTSAGTAVPEADTSAAGRSVFGLLIPTWVFIVIVLALLVVAFRIHRRRQIKQRLGQLTHKTPPREPLVRQSPEPNAGSEKGTSPEVPPPPQPPQGSETPVAGTSPMLPVSKVPKKENVIRRTRTNSMSQSIVSLRRKQPNVKAG